MTIREIIERVESTLVSGLPIQIRGGYISHRWIYSVLKSMRSRILIQKVNKRQNISSWNKQTLHCIALDIVPDEECLCYSSSSLCRLKRTVEKIPDILSGLSDYIIESITSNGNKIDIVNKNSVKYQTFSRFTDNKPVAFIDDGYVWIKNGSYIDHISITAVFDDPIAVVEYNNEHSCDSQSDCCADVTTNEFPVDNDLADTCIMMAIQEISMAFLKQQNNEETDKEEKN